MADAKSTKGGKSPAEVARRDLDAQRETLARWGAQVAATEAELASLQQRAGEEVLDDPNAAGVLARSMQGLRDQLDIARRAVAAQGPRVQRAEAAYLNAEADLLEAVAVDARKKLEAHQTRTAGLLAQLAEHEGVFVPEVQLIDALRSGNVLGTPTEWATPKSEPLEDAAHLAGLRVQILREMAAGRDPAPLLQAQASRRDSTVCGLSIPELYPPCVWGPEAVVPAPAYLRSFQHVPAADEPPAGRELAR